MTTGKTSTLIKLPTTSFRRIITPLEEEGENKKNIRTYVTAINIKDVPEVLDDWREINVRDAKLTSGVAKKIFESLSDNPEIFFYKNRGLTLLADKVRYDNKKNVIEIEMTDKRLNGLLDGGHTYKVIMKFIEDLDMDELSDFNAFVRMEILEGVDNIDDAVAIVDARNTSTQVKDQSLEELKDTFEDIKKVIREKDYSEHIAYKEYELLDDGSKKNIDIREILSYLICFDVEKYGDKKHPIKSYTAKSEIVKDFVSGHRENRIQKYIPLLPKILELRDVIYTQLPDAYNSTGGKFGKLTGVIEVSSRKRMQKVELPFTKMQSNYRIPSGFIYPVLASFRNLVDCKKDSCDWKEDPIKVFQRLKVDLAERVGEVAKELRNPNKLGKYSPAWGRCYDTVNIEVLKRSL